MNKQFFLDIIADPNLNWGRSNFQVKTSVRQNIYGVPKEISSEIVDIDVDCSVQLLKAEDLVNAGLGQYAGRIVYDVYTLDDALLSINTDPQNYRSILFNGQEFEITESAFQGIGKGTPDQVGYFRIRLASVSTNQSGV